MGEEKSSPNPPDAGEICRTPQRGGEADLPPASQQAWPDDKDLVDEAAEESFPASDPPAFHP